MTLNEIHEAIEKIGCLTMTTLDGGIMHSRIVSVCGGDDKGIYFLTMNVKPFYRQLTENSQISACGIYPTGRKTGKNRVGQPYWVPGFTLRITGRAREISQEEIVAGADKGGEMFKYLLEEQERYPAIRLFCIHRGKGEIYDYDFEMERRDHKLLRKRFAFGGETFNEPGSRINGNCISCGACEEACSFKAIEPGEPYRINGGRCDECGSCMLVCPEDAIELSRTI